MNKKFLIIGITILLMAVVFSGLHIVQTAKADEAPEIEWSKTFGSQYFDEAYSIQQTSDGGYIIAGCTVTGSYGAGSYDVWLIKTDGSGNKEWDKTFGGTSDDRGNSVQQTSNGGYIIVGNTRSFEAPGAHSDVWLIKTDVGGNKEWDKIFRGTYEDRGYSVQQTSDGGYILVGATYSYRSGNDDVWLIKTDGSGNKEWDKTFGGTSDDQGNSVQQTTDGGYIITGCTESYGAGSYDVWLIKTDGSGNKEWDKTFGGIYPDWGESVQQTSDGYIIVGYTQSYGSGDDDVWLIKTDGSGNKEWDKTFGGTSDDRGNSVQQTSNGGYIITGIRDSEQKTYYAADVWLIKLKGEGQQSEKPTKADLVYAYYNIFYYDAEQIMDNVDDDLEELGNIANDMIPSSPQDVVLTITGVDKGWAEIAKATIESFNLLQTAERKLILYSIEFSDSGLTNFGSHIKQDGSYKYVDGEPTPPLDTVLLDWYNLLDNEETEEADRFAENIVLPRVLGAIWGITPASTQIKGEANDCLRQVEALLPYESDDPDFDGLKTYYEETALGVALGTDPNNNDTDGDGFIDSKDGDPLHYDEKKNPGFELLLAFGAILLIFFWKRKKKK